MFFVKFSLNKLISLSLSDLSSSSLQILSTIHCLLFSSSSSPYVAWYALAAIFLTFPSLIALLTSTHYRSSFFLFFCLLLFENRAFFLSIHDFLQIGWVYCMLFLSTEHRNEDVYQGPTRQCTINGLSPGEKYFFQVMAVNKAGVRLLREKQIAFILFFVANIMKYRVPYLHPPSLPSSFIPHPSSLPPSAIPTLHPLSLPYIPPWLPPSAIYRCCHKPTDMSIQPLIIPLRC